MRRRSPEHVRFVSIFFGIALDTDSRARAITRLAGTGSRAAPAASTGAVTDGLLTTWPDGCDTNPTRQRGPGSIPSLARRVRVVCMHSEREALYRTTHLITIRESGGNAKSKRGDEAAKVDRTGTTRSGSPKPLVTSGSPSCFVSVRVQTSTLCPSRPNAEKSRGRVIASSRSLIAMRTTAFPSVESVALRSGTDSTGIA